MQMLARPSAEDGEGVLIEPHQSEVAASHLPVAFNANSSTMLQQPVNLFGYYAVTVIHVDNRVLHQPCLIAPQVFKKIQIRHAHRVAYGSV